MTILDLLRRVWQSPGSAIPALLGRLWIFNLLRLKLVARWNGTRLEVGGPFSQVVPVRIQGKGTLSLSPGVGFGYGLSAGGSRMVLFQPREPGSVICIGRGTHIMNGSQFIACHKIEMGPVCMVGPDCLFLDSDFHQVDPARRGEPGESAPISIGENVWIGARATVLKGVRIDRDSIVAAGAVVVRDVAAGEIVAGNPARVIGSAYARHS